MKILTFEKPTSNGGELNAIDVKNQLRAALMWLVPLGLLYLDQVRALWQVNSSLEMKDLIPTPVTIGGMQLYIMNQLYGLFNRWNKPSIK